LEVLVDFGPGFAGVDVGAVGEVEVVELHGGIGGLIEIASAIK
jgi:hypothetical protein